MVSTTDWYAASSMKPVSGEKAPTVSSSTSQALRSDSSTVLVARAAAAPGSAAMRLTRGPPPCGGVRAVAAATALG